MLRELCARIPPFGGSTPKRRSGTSQDPSLNQLSEPCAKVPNFVLRTSSYLLSASEAAESQSIEGKEAMG